MRTPRCAGDRLAVNLGCVEREEGGGGLGGHHLDFAVCFVGLGGAVVEIQAEEGEGDADGLDGGCWGAEPEDCDDDYEDAFD